MPQAYNDRRSGPWTLTAGQTGPHTFDFTIDAASDLRVVRRRDNSLGVAVETELTEATHYTVSVASYPGSGSITLVEAPEADDILVIEGRRPPARPGADFSTERLNADDINTQLDSVWRAIQDVARDAAGNVRVLRSEAADGDLVLPGLAARQASGAGSILAFDGEDGSPLARSYADTAADAAALVGDAALALVTAKGVEQVAAVGAAGDAELADIAAAGDAELADIAAAGDVELADIAAGGDAELADIVAAGATAQTGVAAAAAAEFYADVSAGLAGTSDGDYFFVVDTTDEAIFNLYENNSSTEAFIGALPSVETTNRMDDELAELAQRAIVISHVMGMANATYNPDTGEIVEGSTWYGAVVASAQGRRVFAEIPRSQTIVISMVAGIQVGEIGADGYVDVFKTVYGYSQGFAGETASDPITPGAGQYSNYLAGGQTTGTQRYQVRRLDQIEGDVIDGDVAHVYRPLTAGPYAATFLQEEAEGKITVSRNGEVHTVTTRASSDRLDYSGAVVLVLMLGQSESLGHKDSGPTPIVYNADPVWPLIDGLSGAGMFDSSASDGMRRGPRVLQAKPIRSNRSVALDAGQLEKVVSLHEWTHAGNDTYFGTSSSSCAFTLLSAHFEHGSITLSAHIGTGSTEIAEFQKGSATSEHYNNAVAVIQAAADYAAVLERDLVVCVVWEGQGQKDNADGTTVAAYKASLLDIQADLDADTAIIDATADFYFLVNQSANFSSGELGPAGLAQAELAVAGSVSLVPSWSAKPGASGNAHQIPATYMPRGAAIGHALAELLENNSYSAPWCEFASQDGATIHYTIAGGSGAGYQFDTDTIANALDGAYGHTASDGSGALTVDTMTIDGTDLAVTYTTTPSGTLNWRFGTRTSDGSDDLLPRTAAGRVNIRDDSEMTCPMTGQIVSGWMMQHEGSETL